MATGYTTVSASKLTDASGNPLNNATISFTPCSASGAPLSFQVGGQGQAISAPVSANVVNGAFTIQLADTSLTLPQNICFAVKIVSRLSTAGALAQQLLGPGYLIQPSGSTWDFDAFEPNLPTLALIQTGPQGAAGTDGSLNGEYTGPLVVSSLSTADLAVSDFTDKPLTSDLLGTTAYAIVDRTGAAGLIIHQDGTTEVGSDLKVDGGLTVEGNMTLGSVTESSLQIADVTEKASSSSALIQMVSGVVDSKYQASYGSLIDGSFYGCENARVDVYSECCQDAAGNAYYSQLVTDGSDFGTMQLFCLPRAAGIPLQLTTVGNNVRPRLNPDGYTLSFMSDRSGTMKPMQMDILAAYGVLPAGQDFDKQSTLDHLFVTGQSLAVGHLGTPALSTTQPYSNLMFIGGDAFESTGGLVVTAASVYLASFAPLTTGYLIAGNPAAQTIDNEERITASMANCLFQSMLANDGTARTFLASVACFSGNDYAHIKQGTQTYANALAQFTAGKRNAVAAGYTYRVAAISLLHGEQDQTEGTANYAADLAQFQSNYETDIKAITGQTTGVPMFLSQLSEQANNTTTRQVFIAEAQRQAMLANPARLYITGPKYMYAYADGQHLQNTGYRWEGEYHAKAIRRVVYEHKPWTPLVPLSAVLYKNVITLKFAVPVGPLVIDTTLVTEPTNVAGSRKGFEFYDNSGSTPTITGVAIAGANSDMVQITLSAAPTGTTRQIAYAYTAGSNSAQGGTTGNSPRGNLRDSDPYPSQYGNTLYNWCVHFIMGV
jgi:hypothetical protein